MKSRVAIQDLTAASLLHGAMASASFGLTRCCHAQPLLCPVVHAFCCLALLTPSTRTTRTVKFIYRVSGFAKYLDAEDHGPDKYHDDPNIYRKRAP